MRSAAGVSLILLGALACSAPPKVDSTDTTWVGTITTEGNVTTVINESGSVWGGTATLVEEMSIGVDAGPDEYMLGPVSFVYADEARIYVVQPFIPAVRLYDHSGVYLGDLGGPGQGPGEYELPATAVGTAGGRSFVWDNSRGHIYVYDSNGVSVANWVHGVGGAMALGPDGEVRVPETDWNYYASEGRTGARYGVRSFQESDTEGEVLWAPDIDYNRLTITVGGAVRESVPFAPRLKRVIAPIGIVAGVPERYRFGLHGTDGTVTSVSRHWEPVPIKRDEAAWRKRFTLASNRQREPGWNWTGDDLPSHKPAYDEFIPAASGEVWVVRSGVGYYTGDCVEDPLDDVQGARVSPCWRSDVILDAFGADGRYLGEVEEPDGVRPSTNNLFVRGNLVLAVTEDEAGTIMVKRYRLVLPGEEGR